MLCCVVLCCVVLCCVHLEGWEGEGESMFSLSLGVVSVFSVLCSPWRVGGRGLKACSVVVSGCCVGAHVLCCVHLEGWVGEGENVFSFRYWVLCCVVNLAG